ncbi:MBL fold metallo-hydrolase [Priestia megaterium]|uniref:MBL fold metallo-hydrolase n=1 Tax=Priestia megaterium TaxID=1404 RepID=UPI00119D73CC|nr:MBL fold metallo-hydrolase [Priestia megaterium]
MIDIKVVESSSKGNAYLLDDSKTKLLLECGVGWRQIQKAAGFKTSEIAGCLVTHEHGDHIKSLKAVLKAGIDCYMSTGTANAVNVEHHRIKTVQAKKTFKIGSFQIMAFDVQHDVSEPLGFLIMNKEGDRLLFATDTYYIKYKFHRLTHIMIECNYSAAILDANIALGTVPQVMKKRLTRSHFSLENVKEFFKANDLSQVEEIHLLHLSDSNSDEDLFKEEIMKLTGKPVYIA